MASNGNSIVEFFTTTEPVECLRCGAMITGKMWDDGGMDIDHDHVGAGYRESELLRIGEGDRGIGIVRIIQAAREQCMSPGCWKPLARLPSQEAPAVEGQG